MNKKYKVVISSQNPDLKHSTHDKFNDCWNEFMRHDEVVVKYREFRDSEFSDYHFYIIDNHQNVLAICKSIPTYWDGMTDSIPEGYDDALEHAISHYKAKGISAANTLLGTSVNVFKEFRNLGLSVICLNAMKQLCQNNGFQKLIIPIRPTLKHKYPLIELEDYVKWKSSDGRVFDPWLRVHLDMGGELIGIAKKSMTINGSVNDWEQWTKMRFPSTGSYIIDGALSPIIINCEKNTGVYFEPNVWIVHHIDNKTA